MKKDGKGRQKMDDVLSIFIKKIISEDISEEIFEKYIDMFSRFLGYTNSDYKYNGTYLSQYAKDFISTTQMIKKKNEKYNEILKALIELEFQFKLLIDQVFLATFFDSKIEYGYITINKDNIISKKIELKITISFGNKEYIYCKEYDDFEDENLIGTIQRDIKKYIKHKNDGRTNDELA